MKSTRLPDSILDTLGALALSTFKVDQCRDPAWRAELLREMHAPSERLTAELGPLCNCSEDHAAPASVTQATN